MLVFLLIFAFLFVFIGAGLKFREIIKIQLQRESQKFQEILGSLPILGNFLQRRHFSYIELCYVRYCCKQVRTLCSL